MAKNYTRASDRADHGRRISAARPARTVVTALAVNMTLATLTAGLVGPSTEKLGTDFGLVAWAARTPFYLLPMYLTPVTVWLRPQISVGCLMGVVVAIPLVMWSVATRCPLSVPLSYLVSLVGQGALLSWAVRRG